MSKETPQVAQDRRPSRPEAAPARAAGVNATSWRSVLRSELLKIRTWRTGRALLMVAPLAAAVASAAFVASVPVTMGKSVLDLTPVQQLEVSMLGSDVANIITLVLAILFVADERTTKVLQLSLQLTPARARYLGAKMVAFVAVTVLVSVVSVILAFFGGRVALVLVGAEVPPVFSSQVLRVLGGLSLMGPIHAVMGLAFAFMFRSGLVAFLAAFLVMCLPSLATLLPEGLERAVQFVLFTPALHTLAGTVLPGDVEYTAPGWAVGTLVVWVLVLVAAAIVSFRRQDL